MFSFQNSPSQPAKAVFKTIWHFCSPAKRSFIFKTHFRNPRQPLPKPLGLGGTPYKKKSPAFAGLLFHYIICMRASGIGTTKFCRYRLSHWRTSSGMTAEEAVLRR